MRPSSTFFIMVPVGFFLCAGIFIGLLYNELGVPTRNSEWCYYLITKKKALAANMPSPRLLLVGGSGTLMGLNAGIIQKETGVPTINLGTHAGFGSTYILHIAQEIARPDDIVLLVPEYGIYKRSSSSIADDYILAHDAEYFRRLP